MAGKVQMMGDKVFWKTLTRNNLLIPVTHIFNVGFDNFDRVVSWSDFFIGNYVMSWKSKTYF